MLIRAEELAVDDRDGASAELMTDQQLDQSFTIDQIDLRCCATVRALPGPPQSEGELLGLPCEWSPRPCRAMEAWPVSFGPGDAAIRCQDDLRSATRQVHSTTSATAPDRHLEGAVTRVIGGVSWDARHVALMIGALRAPLRWSVRHQ